MKGTIPLLILFVILVVGGLLIFKGITVNAKFGAGNDSKDLADQKEKNGFWGKLVGTVSGVDAILQSIFGEK